MITYTALFYYLDAPRVIIESLNSSPYMVNVGTKLVLHCIAEGFPEPIIQWYKNNIQIPQASSKLYLTSTDVPGTTMYSCKGRNKAGNMENIASANIIITVRSNIIFCIILLMQNTFGVKKVRPSKVESYLEVNA